MTLRDLINKFGLTQPFGSEGPFGGKHTGVDVGAPAGTPIPALGAGTIESVFFDATGGNQVKVRYDSMAEGWFAHLDQVYSQPGERVSGETIIAKSGASGHVTGPHLHYEQRDPSGQLVDPLSSPLDTYMGGGSDPSVIGDCPTGYVRNLFGVCVPSREPGFNPKNPGVDPITGAGPKAVPGGGGIAGLGSNLNPVDAIGSGFKAAGDAVSGAIGTATGSLMTGARQLVIAGVVVVIIAALSVGGVRRTIE